jgi:hypothetical protein
MKYFRFFLIIFALVFIFSCQSEVKNKEYVISFILGDVLVNGKSAKLDYVFKVGDEVEVGKDSELVISVYGRGNIRIKDEAKFKFEEIQSVFEGKKNDTISLFKGKLLSKVEGIFSDSKRLNVVTESAFATIRGTTFMIKVIGKDTEIKVKKGKLYVAPSVKDRKLVEEFSQPISEGVLVKYDVKLEVERELSKGDLENAKKVYKEKLMENKIGVNDSEFKEIEIKNQEKELEESINKAKDVKGIKEDLIKEKGLFDQSNDEERLEKNIKGAKEKKGIKKDVVKEKGLFEGENEEKDLKENMESLKKKLKK